MNRRIRPQYMDICFRVDSSLVIGIGHVMRCLTIATRLAARGHRCYFFCRLTTGNIIKDIEKRGFTVYVLGNPADSPNKEADATVSDFDSWLGADQKKDSQQTLSLVEANLGVIDWFVVDHYSLDAEWENDLKKCCKKILIIDDLANRTHNCDILLDQTFGRMEKDYAQFVPSSCKILTGSKYALLRTEFAQLREFSVLRRLQPSIKQIIITLGGTDSNNYTSRVLSQLENTSLPSDCRIIVVMGGQAPHLKSVRMQAVSSSWSVEVLVDVVNMAEIIAESDLCIGAAGSTSWERCCLGIPTIMLVIADNQRKVATELNNKGVAIALRSIEELPARITLNTNELKELTKKSLDVCDGKGVGRLINAMFG